MPQPVLTASLPMYDLPALRPAYAAFWDAIRTILQQDGIAGVPDTLRFGQPAVPAAIGSDVLFTQTCGYPLQTIYRGQYHTLGVPDYDLPGCGWDGIRGPSHCGVFLVAEPSPANRLEDLRGGVFACNSLNSNSGMNLPRRTLAPLARGAPFFERVVITDGHLASLAAVRAGEADTTSVDNVTYQLCLRHQPTAVSGLRVVAATLPSPAIPFVTSIATPQAVVVALSDALGTISDSPRYSDIRQRLSLKAIRPPDGSDYHQLLAYEAEARELNFATLS